MFGIAVPLVAFTKAIIGWVTVGGTCAYLGKKAIDKWGDNARNKALRAGLEEQDIQNLINSKSDERKKLLSEKWKDLHDLKDQVKKLEEDRAQNQKNLANLTDPQEKAKMVALINQQTQQINGVLRKIKDQEKEIEEFSNSFPSFNTSAQAKESWLKKPYLNSVKNWGIGISVVILGMMILSLIKRKLYEIFS